VESGRALLDTGSLHVPLGATVEQFVPYAGRRVIAGIRPSALYLVSRLEAPTAAADQGAIAARVDVVEPMGDLAYIYVDIGGQTFAIRIDPLTMPQPGEFVSLRIDGAAVHLFDQATQQALATIPA
jgi:multiple sugar transport system ATP-binding protein